LEIKTGTAPPFYRHPRSSAPCYRDLLAEQCGSRREAQSSALSSQLPDLIRDVEHTNAARSGSAKVEDALLKEPAGMFK
jgi:hypothetical protein